MRELNQITIPFWLELLEYLETPIALTANDHTLLWVNHAFAECFQVDSNQVVGKPFTQIHPEVLQQILTSTQTGTFELPGHPARLFKHVCVKPVNNADQIAGVHYFYDKSTMNVLSSNLHEISDQLVESHLRDPLTGLLTQRAFVLVLEPQLARCRRYGNQLTLLALNLQFIEHNNSIDRNAQHLRKASQTIKETIRWADQLAVDTEGNFLLLLPETNKQAAGHLINKINQLLSTMPAIASVHCGVTEWAKGDTTVSLLARGREALDDSLNHHSLIATL